VSEPLALQLASEVVALASATMPPPVLTRARDLLLDFLGVALGGVPEASSSAVREALSRLVRGGEVPVLGTTQRLPAPQAALANGAAAHALEMDDTHLGGSIHLGASVFPAALAAAAIAPARGETLLRAAVAGYEVAARVAMALRPARHYARGYHPTGTCGAFGAAAAAGIVFGLDRRALASALGIAGSQGAGSLEFLADGSWTKRLHPGWAACAGLHAAALARAGFVGPQTIFEGRFGVLQSWSDTPDASLLRPGDGYELLHTGIKPHACCRYMQGPIDAVLALRGRHGLRPQDIERIEVGLVAAGFPIVCEPRERKLHPQSVVDAQFSLPYGVAVALTRGRAGPAEFAPPVLDDPEVRQLMPRVVAVQDPTLDARYPRTWPCWVRVARRGQPLLEEHVEHPLGDPEHFPDAATLEVKFRELAARSLASAQVESVLALVGDIASLDDAAQIAEAAALER